MTYTADGLQSTLVAINARTGRQTTTYTYGTTLSNSAIASNAGDANEIVLAGGANIAWSGGASAGTLALVVGTAGVGSVDVFGGGTSAAGSTVAASGVIATPQAAALTTLEF